MIWTGKVTRMQEDCIKKGKRKYCLKLIKGKLAI